MAKSLVIVESPAKAKTIQKYLGKDYEVVASKGHIKDLPKKGGVDHDNGFQETYAIIEEKGKAEVVKGIREKAKRVDHVLLATDPDREGEAIAYHLMEEVLDANKGVPVSRVLFNEITKKGVAEGIANPRELDGALYEAQRTRRVLDRIGGYPLSSLLWKKLAFGLSAGRVQTPALRIIVDRLREIQAFVPQDYWLVDVQLVGKKRPHFHAALVDVNGTKLERIGSRPSATSQHDADRYVADLKTASYRVAKITRREQKRHAPAPYSTSKLQQDGSTRLGMAPKRAMRIAQTLYEGVELGKEGLVGLITYMRTDSVRLSDDAVTEARAYIAKTFGDESVPAKPNVYKTKKGNVQDAHEAIRPTRVDLPPSAVRADLSDEQFKLYKMIWDRFIACQMTPAVYDQTGVDIEAAAKAMKYGLRASGSVLKVPGWKAVYGASVEPLAGEEEQQEGADDTVEEGLLPELTENEALTLVIPPGVTGTHKQTEPPPYYNEASLVKKLEEEGIGRPSTYAEILSKVQARDYVAKVGNRLVPSDLGCLVIDKLVADNFDLADISFTRKLEEDLDAVAESRAKRLDVLAPFHKRLMKQIEHAESKKGKWWPEPEMLDEECPECGAAKLMKRWGRNGAFIGCTTYPTCKYTRNIPKPGEDPLELSSREPEMTDVDCALCGSKMMKRWGKNGFFLGCSAYPKCKSTRNMPLGVTCPKCTTGEIVEIRAKGRGRPFYGCSNYANAEIKCDFKLWQKPVPDDCPQCGAKFLVKAGGKKKPVLKCATEGCGFEKPDEAELAAMDGSEESGALQEAG